MSLGGIYKIFHQNDSGNEARQQPRLPLLLEPSSQRQATLRTLLTRGYPGPAADAAGSMD
jgi:hypothetical protein